MGAKMAYPKPGTLRCALASEDWSDYCADWTEYNDGCEDWEGRENETD